MTEWTSLTEASKQLGLPRELLKSKIHNGCIPFRMVGTRFQINLKLTRAYLAREDVQNMLNIRNELQLTPLSRRKVNVRKVVE